MPQFWLDDVKMRSRGNKSIHIPPEWMLRIRSSVLGLPLELRFHHPLLVRRSVALRQDRVGGVLALRRQAAVRVHVPDATILEKR